MSTWLNPSETLARSRCFNSLQDGLEAKVVGLVLLFCHEENSTAPPVRPTEIVRETEMFPEACVSVLACQERERDFFDFEIAEPSPGPMRGAGDTPNSRANLARLTRAVKHTSP